MTNKVKRPSWLRGRVSWDGKGVFVDKLLKELGLNSVCGSAACPNKGECWEKGHVTFMILGKDCTRGCKFCNIEMQNPVAPDPYEPRKIAEAIKKLGLKHVVITSVTRDDLPDHGAGQFTRTVKEIKKNTPAVSIELLVPDMGGDACLLGQIGSSGAEIIGHNIEMPEVLYPLIRSKADYRRSLKVLSFLKKNAQNIAVKSSLIIGLGETTGEIVKTIGDLKEAGIDILHIGQYLNPSRAHWPVKKYYTSEEFAYFRRKAETEGIKTVFSAPMVRSSYRAYEAYLDFLGKTA